MLSINFIWKIKARKQLKSSESSNPLQYDSICLRLSDKELAKYREEEKERLGTAQ